MYMDNIAHRRQVTEETPDVAERTGADLDMELIGRGALFHD